MHDSFSNSRFRAMGGFFQPSSFLLFALTFTGVLGGGTCRAHAAAELVGYYDDIKPLLAVHCYKCHGPENTKGGLRLDLRDGAMGAGKSGVKAIVPGKSGRSEIVRRIISDDPDELMPKKGERLSPNEIEHVRQWIDRGAHWPDKDDYWAFQPPIAPALPTPSRPTSGNPIDRFIDARLESEKIAPAPSADARTLLRRAYGDLLGVPPTPAEADAFLKDQSADAWEKLIDRLLADPRYGERWGRFWLDLVRYSESDGFEDDKIRPHAWRYRDYVIRSFNSDKPYDRFVQEQIAGDELWPREPDAWIATGFARLGMWDGMSKDPPRQRQDFLNDVTDATGSVFLGMTVGCARCHDHKYDQITQRDYYSLQSFYAGATREIHSLGDGANDPPQVMEARRTARVELSRLHGEKKAALDEARAELQWEHRCEVNERGEIAISDEQVKARVDRRHPGRLGDIDAKIKASEYVEQLNDSSAEVVLERSASPPKIVLLQGGELSRPGPEALPRFIEAMAPGARAAPRIEPFGGSSGRRTALARWMTSSDNPLVARVWVNRLWQHHFGRGLIATPSDFGRHGQRPTHRELLDWLACRLVADGWSTKSLHRLMMTSAAYRRSSDGDGDAIARDPENKLLWRMNRRRLEAEAIRDSILTVSGRVSPVRGGPGVYPRISKDVNVQLPNNDKELSWGTCTEEENCRRSIYIFQRRSLTFPLMDVFDSAPMSQTCPVRAQTTVAPQALALLNGEFCREEAHHFAERVARVAGDDSQRRIERVFMIALSRQPTADERTAAVSFLKTQAEIRRNSGSRNVDSAAFDDFCHVILNSNEFIFLD